MGRELGVIARPPAPIERAAHLHARENTRCQWIANAQIDTGRRAVGSGGTHARENTVALRALTARVGLRHPFFPARTAEHVTARRNDRILDQLCWSPCFPLLQN